MYLKHITRKKNIYIYIANNKKEKTTKQWNHENANRLKTTKDLQFELIKMLVINN